MLVPVLGSEDNEDPFPFVVRCGRANLAESLGNGDKKIYEALISNLFKI